MKPFTKRKRGRLWARLADVEARLLVSLSGQVIALLEERHAGQAAAGDPLIELVGPSGPLQAPEDPVLRRLLPDAYTDDAEESAEFRRLTERGLALGKATNARAIVESLLAAGFDPAAEDGPEVEVELDADTAQAWLRALTDIRLALATRLGIDEEEDVALIARSEDSELRAMFEVYEWLGYVQESLVAVLR